MERKFILLVLGLCLSTLLPAQNLSWKKHVKLADELYEVGEFAEAASHYEAAFQQKPKKTELAFKAAETYYNIKDYQSAANAYEHVKDMNDVYPLVGLKYARCLKQSEQYDAAIEAFRNFGDSYAGQSKNVLMGILDVEIQGCELGKSFASERNSEINIELLGKSINTGYTEFSPFPYSSDILFFSSTREDKAKIYRSQNTNGIWSKPSVPENFPLIANEHFCNGAMSPDGQHFYFNICDSGKAWDVLNTRCEIFVIKKLEDSWSDPQRLPEYVNMEGVTSVQPYSVHENGKEFLYFASNREGGQSGMDIWVITRDLDGNDLEFTFPENLGAAINTLGDELSPVYDKDSKTLYFSSNGHATVGGFDIFKSTFNGSNWSLHVNMGSPLNSSADDYSYVLNKAKNSGYLVSNRKFGGLKPDTRHEDIFSFSTGKAGNYVLEGKVYNYASGQQLNSIRVALYELSEAGVETLLANRPFSNGAYEFELKPNRIYKVEINALDHMPVSYQFVTDDPTNYIYGKPVRLKEVSSSKPYDPASDDTVTDASKPSTKPLNQTNTEPEPGPIAVTREEMGESSGSTPYTSRGKSAKDNYEIVSTAPRYKGTYYKIQLIAVKTFNEDHDRYKAVKKMGRLDTEFIVEKKLTRVLLADYGTLEEAKDALADVKNSGFSGAYIIQYKDGERYGRVK
mgnify:CR=1 FL=1